MKRNAIIATILLAGLSASAGAKNVDLVTLPRRDSVQLTIYNSEDITLVKETRYVTLQKGSNRLQFSWAGTLIDPSSVEFRPLEQAGKIEVADTIFPGQKPQHLIWNVVSQIEGQVKVEVTYFTSGLTWSMDYVAVTDPGQTRMKFRGYVRVYNNSGEQYENAEIRLIVGTINLVEKIADLARRRGIPMPQPASTGYIRLRREVADKSFARAGAASKMVAARKRIVKEGLSEYFMFSVAGTETIPDGWSKRMEAVKADQVRFDIVYRMRSYQYGPRPVRFFIWRNDDEHKLGQSPLPDGQVRIFGDNGSDGLRYLGQQQVRYVPIKARIEINLGPDDLVVHETRKSSTRRLNFSFRRVGSDRRKKEVVDGWDERTEWIDTIRNYRAKPIAFELRRQWPGNVEYGSEVKTSLFDFHTIEAKFTVPARGRKQYPCTVLSHFGTNTKGQNRIELVSN